MKLLQLSMLLTIFLFCNKVMAQTFEGVWKGTSICQVKNSPCHDENDVYYISKGTGKTYEIKAYKIVEGKEDFMGTIMFAYDEKQDLYVSVNKDPAKWEFKITGNIMKGSLVVKGNLYRIVELKKEN
jgi:hypothetical protein